MNDSSLPIFNVASVLDEELDLLKSILMNPL